MQFVGKVGLNRWQGNENRMCAVEYHCLESDFDSTLVQIIDSHLLLKVYTTSFLNTCTRGQKVGTHKTTIAHNREENSRK